MKKIPVICLDPKNSMTAQLATVAFTTATYGINTPGTVYRMDDIPIPLRPALETPHRSDQEILEAILERVKELQRGLAATA
jgi:formylmethanofuran dehydrogenase subunit B